MKKQNALFKVAMIMIISMLCYDSAYSQTPSNNAFGDNMVLVDSTSLGGGNYQNVFAIYSGDINQDGYIDVFDFPQFDQDNFNQAVGYFVTDLNGDGYVDVFDFPVFDKNNFNQVSLLRP